MSIKHSSPLRPARRDHKHSLSSGCPLLNPALPPVTDLEHSINSCFCYMCTCSEHSCPNNFQQKSLSHSKQFDTSYKLCYTKPTRIEFKLEKRKDHYIRPSLSVESKTISQTSYIPYEVKQIVRKSPDPRQKSPYKFNSHSVYNSAYPNWGNQEKEMPIKHSPTYHTITMKLKNRSQYQEAYIDSAHTDKMKFYELAKTFKARNWKSDGIISPSNEFIGQAKITKDYPALPLVSKPKLLRNIDNQITNIETWKGQFVSTYHGDYNGQIPLRFIRRRELSNKF